MPQGDIRVTLVRPDKRELPPAPEGAYSERAGLGASVLVGLIGAGIQESRTPHMHEAEGARLGLRYIYKLLDIEPIGLGPEALPDLVRAAELTGFVGLNVTHPFKQSILPLLDELSSEAAAIGAVNTVVFQRGKRIGHNTDCWGFAESFRRQMAESPVRTVVQIGAGGAGTAVARALMDVGVESLIIHDANGDRALTLASALSREYGAGRATAVSSPATALAHADGLVNATPMGMAKYPGLPVDADLLRPALWVADIVYFPLETELLRAARKLGSRTLSGAGMALFQAVKAFELFSGIRPDADAMRRHFEAD